METTTKLSVNGNAVAEECPKCKSEGSLFVSSILKWGKVAKWQHVVCCTACTYESKVK